MKKITDKQRMDFLESQGFTRWVGHGAAKDFTCWPVFEGQSFRAELDRAIRSSAQQQSPEPK